jgi:hypothetical protein
MDVNFIRIILNSKYILFLQKQRELWEAVLTLLREAG